MLGGRAFTAYAARAPPAPGTHPSQLQLQLCLELFGQRLDTAPVAASVEPAFAGEAFFTLPVGAREPGAAGGGGGGGAGVSVDPLQLLALRQGLHAVVLQLTPMAAEDDGKGWGGGKEEGYVHLAMVYRVRGRTHVWTRCVV